MKRWLWFILLSAFGWEACHQPVVPKAPVVRKIQPDIREHFSPENGQIALADTLSVKKLLGIAREARFSNTDSAIATATEALYISQQTGSNKYIALSLYAIGACYYDNKKNPANAEYYFATGLDYAKKAALSDADSTALINIYIGLANVFFSENQFDSALNYYYRITVILERQDVKDSSLLMTSYINIGAIMLATGRTGKSRYYLTKADRMVSANTDANKRMNLYKAMAGMYAREIDTANAAPGHIDSTIYYLRKVAIIAHANGNKQYEQQAFADIGSVYLLHANNIDKALLYFDSAVSIAPEIAAENISLTQNLGAAYLAKGAYKKAIPYCEHTLKLCEAQQVSQVQLNAYWALADIYSHTGNYQQAFKYQRQHSLHMNTLHSNMLKESLNRIEAEYRTQEKDKQLLQNQLLIARQQSSIRGQYLWLGGALLFIIILSALLLVRQHRTRLVRLQARLEGEEQERLRLSRELHDGIVSQLSSIKMNFSALSAGDIPGQHASFSTTLTQLEQSIAELRATSHNLHPVLLQRAGLLQALAIYCDKINTQGTLDITFQTVGSLPALQADAQLHIYRITQELIQNIIKHAHATQCLLQVSIANDKLSITLDDNGKESLLQKSRDIGIGLENIQSRLELLKGKIDMERDEKGSSIYIIFDLKTIAA